MKMQCVKVHVIYYLLESSFGGRQSGRRTGTNVSFASLEASEQYACCLLQWQRQIKLWEQVKNNRAWFLSMNGKCLRCMSQISWESWYTKKTLNVQWNCNTGASLSSRHHYHSLHKMVATNPGFSSVPTVIACGLWCHSWGEKRKNREIHHLSLMIIGQTLDSEDGFVGGISCELMGCTSLAMSNCQLLLAVCQLTFYLFQMPLNLQVMIIIGLNP